MAHFVFRPQSSTGARELADALGGRRLRRFQDGRFYSSRTRPNPITTRPGDTIVMWGSYLPGLPQGLKVLNNTTIHSKFEDAQILQRAGVATVEVSRTRPAAAPAAPVVDPAISIHRQLLDQLEDLIEAPMLRNDIYRRGLGEVSQRISSLIGTLGTPLPTPAPAQPAGDWVGRMNDHVGGSDLLTPPPTPDFWVKKLDIVEEYRVHSFGGRSIRAGIKKHREGFHGTRSTWIRSYDGGWTIDYTEFKSKEAMRVLAHAAVTALGLQFGAVDIGKLRNGTLIVLEVNRAPGTSDGTVTAYANAIQKWSDGQWEPAAVRPQGRRAA